MQLNLRLAVWNANGLRNKLNEIELFLRTKHIDIFLISETHQTYKSHVKIRGYDYIGANHPGERAHAGSGIFIKSTLEYEIAEIIEKPFLQAAGIKIKSNNQYTSVYSVYFPPRHSVSCEDYENFFMSIGSRFIVAGDFNAKHPWWGSRLINPKGRQLYNCIVKHNFKTLSGGRPTYWPSDPNKIPDLLDFAVFKGIPTHFLDVLNDDDLSSDHTPLIINYSTTFDVIAKNLPLFSPKTDINYFGSLLNQKLDLNFPINTGADLDDAVEIFNRVIHEAAVLSTPHTPQSNANGTKVKISAEIRNLVRNKRRLRRIWKRSRNPVDKRNLNLATKNLTEQIRIYKNKEIASYLRNLNPSSTGTEYNLWKATKYLKRPAKRNIPVKDLNNSWCRTNEQKASAFAVHLQDTFQPFCLTSKEQEVTDFLDIACQMDKPIKHVTPKEVSTEIRKLNKGKSPGYDKVNSKVAKALPWKGIIFLTLIFNSILRLQHFPTQWKCAEIVMVPKPNKPENKITSYRPISLLTTFSKIFERLFVQRLLPILEKCNIIPEHQFGFRHLHGTPEQCHRVVKIITEALQRKMYCSAVFLDVQQAFDKVWHKGLLYKLKKLLPAPYFMFLKSYLHGRSFYVKVNNTNSNIYRINAGIPQGSVLGPILYTIFTYDMPCIDGVTVATYADDTTFLHSSESMFEASLVIQNQLDILHEWLIAWNIMINPQKSSHITFTLRLGNCPDVYLNGSLIPHCNSTKYLGLHLDRRLRWKDHLKAKKSQIDLKFKKMYWLLGPKSELSLENKVLLYKSILKPIWCYGIHLWGTCSNTNIKLIQTIQSKILRSITSAPWFVSNKTIHNDLNIPFVTTEINKYSAKYLLRLSNHTNPLAIMLLDESNDVRRLKRYDVLDLPFRQ